VTGSRPTISDNDAVASGGKRAGSRRGPKRQRSLSPSLLGLAGGVTLAVVAWGYLVFAAIDFGATARNGDSQAWWFLALASLGAVACLFGGLILIARLVRLLGLTGGSRPASSAESSTPLPPEASQPQMVASRPAGGRRAAR
jgi:hypothetical protein